MVNERVQRLFIQNPNFLIMHFVHFLTKFFLLIICLWIANTKISTYNNKKIYRKNIGNNNLIPNLKIAFNQYWIKKKTFTTLI